jgi:hypothetical protein
VPVPREERHQRRGEERDHPSAALGNAARDLRPEEEEQHVPRRHEERDVAQPVAIQAPREREHDFAGGGDREARGERDARVAGTAREEREAHDPRRGARGGLAVRGPVLVEGESEEDGRDDGEVHVVRILACAAG